MLFKDDKVTFHRIEFEDSQFVDSAIKDLKIGELLEESFCNIRSIELEASNGYIADIHINIASKSILENVKYLYCFKVDIGEC